MAAAGGEARRGAKGNRQPGHPCLTLAMITVGATVTAWKFIAGGMAPFTAAVLHSAVALPVFGLAVFGLAVRPTLPRLPARIRGCCGSRRGRAAWATLGS